MLIFSQFTFDNEGMRSSKRYFSFVDFLVKITILNFKLLEL